MKELDRGYSAEVDKVDQEAWSDLLVNFTDASIYQSWSYGRVRWGERNLSHLVLKRDGAVTALAQVSIKKIPFLKCGIAYVPWGPIWRSKENEADFERFRQVARALRNEYAMRRGLLLRIAPNEIEGPENQCLTILVDEGYGRKAQPYRTLLVDLSASMEDLHKGLARRWKRALETAEAKRLRIMEGTSREILATLDQVYSGMVSRKGFVPGVSMADFRDIQLDLPEKLKMKIMVCEHEGKPVAALMASLIGAKGIGLIGGTETNGLSLGGFHLLNWKMMEWMKAQGVAYYDLGGYDPEKNPGTARFKAGLPGKDVRHIGQFEASGSVLSSAAVAAGEAGQKFLQRGKVILAGLRRKSKEDKMPGDAAG